MALGDGRGGCGGHAAWELADSKTPRLRVVVPLLRPDGEGVEWIRTEAANA